jgi:hypothetical protein
MGGADRSPYEDPRADVERRKDEYLATILAAHDDDGPVKRRGYLRRASDRPNPVPSKLGELNQSLNLKTSSFLTGKPAEPWSATYEYQYLSAEDVNMALARLVAGGPDPIPDVFPARERPDPAKSSAAWTDIPAAARELPPLNRPASTPMLLAIVQLLH